MRDELRRSGRLSRHKPSKTPAVGIVSNGLPGQSTPHERAAETVGAVADLQADKSESGGLAFVPETLRTEQNEQAELRGRVGAAADWTVGKTPGRLNDDRRRAGQTGLAAA